MIYKGKGKDPRSPSSYRPISLANSFYKLYASMLQHRIASSIDYILSPHQFGFRKSRSTSTPVFLIRRLLEHFERHTTSLYLLFLDWQQAFDSVSREAVQTALVRYGLPEAIINPVMGPLSRLQILCPGRVFLLGNIFPKSWDPPRLPTFSVPFHRSPFFCYG